MFHFNMSLSRACAVHASLSTSRSVQTDTVHCRTHAGTHHPLPPSAPEMGLCEKQQPAQ